MLEELDVLDEKVRAFELEAFPRRDILMGRK